MKLHIGNLPKSVTEQELTDLVTPFASPSTLEIVKDPSGESKGYGFAEFASDDNARAVITGLDGKDLGGNTLKIGEARPRESKTQAAPPATQA